MKESKIVKLRILFIYNLSKALNLKKSIKID